MSHPFGDLIAQHLHRKHGLSQAKLAAGILQAPTVISRMCRGERLTGPQARERVLAIIGWLREQGALETAQEANALLDAAGMAPLRDGVTAEAVLLQRLQSGSPSQPATFPEQRDGLPVPLTTLIGRDDDIASTDNLIHRGDVRLVTFLGPPGVGKTRLAIAVAGAARNHFPQGAHFVALAPISDPTFIASATIEALGLAPSRLAPVEHLKTDLRGWRALLVLDNVEQLLSDKDSVTAAAFVADLLAAAPGLKIITTSRATLRVYGEHVREVAPLALPSAIELFVRRAQAIRMDFALTAEDAPVVAAICRRLDGLPLAIELAAAQLDVLPVQSILSRLDQRLAILRRGPRDAPARHQTLQAAIDWSYSLLTEAERTGFRRLSVCVGGFTLQTLAAIMPAHPGRDQSEAILADLVNKSLIQRARTDAGQPRFGQLETLREYGLTKLAAASELDSARRSHALHFTELAEAAEPNLYGGEQAVWLERLSVEHDNLRAALHWSIQTGEASIASRLGIALWHFWYIRSHHHEGMRRLGQILDMSLPRDARAQLLYGSGMLARRTNDLELVDARLREALDLFRDVEDAYGIASVLRVLGFMSYKHDELERARQELSEALHLFNELDHAEGMAATLANLAYVHQGMLDWVTAKRYQEQSLALRRKTGNRHGVATSLDSLGLIAVRMNDLQAARAFQVESAELYAELGNRESASVPMSLLGVITYLEGDYARARAHFEAALNLVAPRANKEHVASIEVDLALANLQLGADMVAIDLLHRAMHFLRAARALEPAAITLMSFCVAAARNGYPATCLRVASTCERIKAQAQANVLYSSLNHDLELAVQTARSQLGAEDATAAWAHGAAMTLDDAIVNAIDICVALLSARRT